MSVRKINAIVLNEKDNVATAITAIGPGSEARCEGAGMSFVIPINETIPFGFKLAIFEIPKGTNIVKYGQIIGRSTASVKRGQMVHIHNTESLRGRGDW